MIWRLRRLIQRWRFNFAYHRTEAKVRYRACWRPGCPFRLAEDRAYSWGDAYSRKVWTEVLRQHDRMYHGRLRVVR